MNNGPYTTIHLPKRGLDAIEKGRWSNLKAHGIDTESTSSSPRVSPLNLKYRCISLDKSDFHILGEHAREARMVMGGEEQSFDAVVKDKGREYQLTGFNIKGKFFLIIFDWTDPLKSAPGIKVENIEGSINVFGNDGGRIVFHAANKLSNILVDRYNAENGFTPDDKEHYAKSREDLAGESPSEHLRDEDDVTAEDMQRALENWFKGVFAGHLWEQETWDNLEPTLERKIEDSLNGKGVPTVRNPEKFVSGRNSDRHKISIAFRITEDIIITINYNVTPITDKHRQMVMSKNPRDLFNSHFRDPNRPTYMGAVDEGRMTQKTPFKKDYIPLPNPFPTFMLPAFLLTAGAISSNERVFQKGAAGSRWGDWKGPVHSGEGKNPDSDNQQPSFYCEGEESDVSSYNQTPFTIQLPDGALVFHFRENGLIDVRKEEKKEVEPVEKTMRIKDYNKEKLRNESKHLIPTQNAEKARNENNIGLKVSSPNIQKEGEKNSIKTPVSCPNRQPNENAVKIQVPSSYKQDVHEEIAQKSKERNDLVIAQKLKWENDIKNPIPHKQSVDELQRSPTPYKNGETVKASNIFLSVPCLIDSNVQVGSKYASMEIKKQIQQPNQEGFIQAQSLAQETIPAREHLNGPYTHESIPAASSSSLPTEKLPPEKPKAVARQSVVKGPENLPILIAQKRKRVKESKREKVQSNEEGMESKHQPTTPQQDPSNDPENEGSPYEQEKVEAHSSHQHPLPIRVKKAKASPTIIIRKRGKTKRKKRGKKTEGKKKNTGRRKEEKHRERKKQENLL